MLVSLLIPLFSTRSVILTYATEESTHPTLSKTTPPVSRVAPLHSFHPPPVAEVRGMHHHAWCCVVLGPLQSRDALLSPAHLLVLFCLG